MNLPTLLLTAVALSMDAFAISLSIGISRNVIDLKAMFSAALAFGFFQFLMPVLGWLAASSFSQYIRSFDHWIAFLLLAFIGGKMLFESLRGGGEECPPRKLTLRSLLMLAIATSIDALAVGVSFALIEVNIWTSSLLIGCVTFLLCALGVLLGRKLGNLLGKWAEIAGGIILILIGLKILIEHLLSGS